MPEMNVSGVGQGAPVVSAGSIDALKAKEEQEAAEKNKGVEKSDENAEVTVEIDDGCTDGADDGKIGFWDGLKSFGKGFVDGVQDFFKGLFGKKGGFEELVERRQELQEQQEQMSETQEKLIQQAEERAKQNAVPTTTPTDIEGISQHNTPISTVPGEAQGNSTHQSTLDEMESELERAQNAINTDIPSVDMKYIN